MDLIEKSVEFDPAAVHHFEAAWLPRAEGIELPALGSRLAGHSSAADRVSLDGPAPARTDRREHYGRLRERLVERHGGRALLSLETTATMYGIYAPHLISLSAWPSAAALGDFEADRELTRLREEQGIAEVAVTHAGLDPEFHASQTAFEMAFDSSSTYELCALWHGGAWTLENQRTFIESATPSRSRHRAGAGVVFAPSGGDYAPDMLCLSQWPSLDDFAGFVTDPEHASVSRVRARAFDRMDATATRLFLQRG